MAFGFYFNWADEWPDEAVPDDSGYAYDDEISTALLAKWTDEGRLCCECGTEFTEGHGKRTACGFCWRRMTVEERQVTWCASHPEKNQAAHADQARKRKSRKAT